MTNPPRPRRAPRLLAGLATAAVACAMLIPFAGSAEAATAATVQAATPSSQQYVPTRVPDRIVLTPAADASTAQSVTWRTSTAVTPSQAKAEIRGAVAEA